MASDSGSQHRTLAIAAIALGKIVELGLPADPRSYELWYIYATGKNQKLRDEVDAALRGNGTLTESDIDRLHTQHQPDAQRRRPRPGCQQAQRRSWPGRQDDQCGRGVRRAL